VLEHLRDRQNAKSRARYGDEKTGAGGLNEVLTAKRGGPRYPYSEEYWGG